MRGTKLYAMLAAMFMAGAFLASPELRVYAANTVFSADIKDGEVKTPDLANNAVTSAKIKDGEVKTDDIAPSAIGSLRIKDNDVKAQDIAPNAVGASELGDSAVNSAKIQDGTIVFRDMSQSFFLLASRADCNCGGTGWDPDGVKRSNFVSDNRVTANSVIVVSLDHSSKLCSANPWIIPNRFLVVCDSAIPNGESLNYAIFNPFIFNP